MLGEIILQEIDELTELLFDFHILVFVGLLAHSVIYNTKESYI